MRKRRSSPDKPQAKCSVQGDTRPQPRLDTRAYRSGHGTQCQFALLSVPEVAIGCRKPGTLVRLDAERLLAQPAKTIHLRIFSGGGFEADPLSSPAPRGLGQPARLSSVSSRPNPLQRVSGGTCCPSALAGFRRVSSPAYTSPRPGLPTSGSRARSAILSFRGASVLVTFLERWRSGPRRALRSIRAGELCSRW